MTRSLMMAAGVGGVLALAACSTDFCHFELRSKLGNCDGGSLLAPPCPRYAAACEGAVSQHCSANDVSVFNRELSCIESLPNCVAGQESAWTQRLFACTVSDGGTISLQCTGALSAAYFDAGC